MTVSIEQRLVSAATMPAAVEVWELKDAVLSAILRSHGLDVDGVETADQSDIGRLTACVDRLVRCPGLLRIPFDGDVLEEVHSALMVKLLDFRQLLLRRQMILSTRTVVNEAQEQARAVSDRDTRELIEQSLARIQSTVDGFAARSKIAASAGEAALADLGKREDLTLRLKLSEHRWNLVRPLLGRESMAILAGGLMLIALGISLVVAMFLRVPASEIVANAFLLILGFFFGNAKATRRT